MGASGKALALIMLVALAPGCSSSSAKGVDAAGTHDVGQTSDVGQPSDVIRIIDVGQGHDVPPEVSADAALVPPTSVMFPEAPDIACGGDAAECPLPPSACADPSCDGSAGCPGLAWVVYYDSPTCVNGKCAYTNRYFECDMSSRCSAGGCRFNGTLAAPQ